MKFIPLAFSIILFCSTALSAQTIRFVNHSALGLSDGSSWTNAFTQFQQALAVAQDGDEIWVAKGIYKPTSSNDRYARYDLPSGVSVYGGFAGTETLREQRDWTANLTILSGDIGNLGDSTDNSFNILYSYSPNEKTRLDGLIFEEGNANNTDNGVDYHRPTRSGGGIYLDGEGFGYAQLSVSNCTFRNNGALHQGGGIFANGREGGMAIVRLENCLFEQNYSDLFGGAFSLENYFEQPFALEIKRCEFRENQALTYGSTIWLRAHQAVKFSDCKFSNNSSITGGTIYLNLLESNHPLEFQGCFFEKNGNYVVQYNPNFMAPNKGSFKFKSCVFSENGLPVVSLSTDKIAEATFENCLFNSNKNTNSSSSGTNVSIGGVPDAGSIKFINTLFYNNFGREISAPSAEIKNCIIIDEIAQSYGSDRLFWGKGPFNVSNSLFRLPGCDSLAGNYNTPPLIICDSTNLFHVDPLFVNPGTGPSANFHLKACSPAINAGMNAILDSLGITTDLQGNPRVRNSVVDMGPYETNLSLYPSVSVQPVCAGSESGEVIFAPNICPPFSFEWSNGVTTGSNTTRLTAGTYIFSTLGANNIPVFDTIVISEPSPVDVGTIAHDERCFGSADGWFEATASGGTPGYAFSWDSIAGHFDLSAGTYGVTATDANGCTGTAQAIIGSPDPFQFFFSTQDASCPNCSDGSIFFDSILGGTNLPLPAPIFNLSPGNYGITITDAQGCTAILNYSIGFTTGTAEQYEEKEIQLSPNPTAFGKTATLQWFGNELTMLRILDFQGRVLEEKALATNSTFTLTAHWPPGIYQVEIRTESGKIEVRRWVIF